MATLTNKQRKRIMTALRKRKARKVSRSMRPGYKGINKSYNYNFTPGTQWISNYGVAAANAVNITPTTLSGPLNPAAPGSTFVKVSQSSIPGYSDVGIAMPFSLLDVANYTVFSSVYDQYKLNWVKVKMTYLSNAASVNGAGLLPEVYYVVDNDDAVIPQSQNSVKAKQGSICFGIGDGNKTSRTITIKPKLAQLVNIGATKANIQTGGWVDCNTQTALYYGLKMWITNMYLPAPGTQNTAIQFDYTYNVSFRGAQNLF